MTWQRGMAARWFALAMTVLVALLSACADDPDVAEQADPPPATIAFLRAVDSGQPATQAEFIAELRKGGYVEGENLRLLAKETTEVHSDPADVDATVAKWVADGVDLIVALSTSGAKAAAAAAPEANVVFLANDPRGAGLVENERAPSGRLTGVTFRVPPDRTLDLAREAFPDVTAVGAVYPSSDPAALAIKDGAVRAAGDLGVRLVEATFADPNASGAAVESLAAQGVQAVWILNSPTSFRAIGPIIEAATARRLPVVTNTAADAAAVTLQPETTELYRQMARQARRLLAGDPASAIPVENPSRFELIVNTRAAAAVGVTIPPGLVGRADRVIR